MSLQAEYFIIGTDAKNCRFLQLQGCLSKIVTGDIDCRARSKLLRQHADPTSICYSVGIVVKYLAAIVRERRLYRRPHPNKSGKVCFWQQHVGISNFCKYVRTMFNKAGIHWREQRRNNHNHSGKAACCTQLYEHGLDEQAITMRSENRSRAVRDYRQPSQKMLRDISYMLQPPNPATVTSATMKTEEPAAAPPPGPTMSTTTYEHTTHCLTVAQQRLAITNTVNCTQISALYSVCLLHPAKRNETKQNKHKHKHKVEVCGRIWRFLNHFCKGLVNIKSFSWT